MKLWKGKLKQVIYKTGFWWDPNKSLATKKSLDEIFEGNTIEIRCNTRWVGLLRGGNRKVGENIVGPVAQVFATAANQINSFEDKFSFPKIKPLISSSAKDFCPFDLSESRGKNEENQPAK